MLNDKYYKYKPEVNQKWLMSVSISCDMFDIKVVSTL